MNCPWCNSENIIKNGSIHNSKPKYACKDCSRQLVQEPTNSISQEKEELIDKLLLEKIPLTGIARVVEVSEYFLQNYINKKYDSILKIINFMPKKRMKLLFNVMKCGLLLDVKITNNGFGLQLILKLDK